MSSLKVHELNLYLVRHGIVFKGKKPEKVAYIYSTYRWQDLIRHYGERDFVKKA